MPLQKCKTSWQTSFKVRSVCINNSNGFSSPASTSHRLSSYTFSSEKTTIQILCNFFPFKGKKQNCLALCCPRSCLTLNYAASVLHHNNFVVVFRKEAKFSNTEKLQNTRGRKWGCDFFCYGKQQRYKLSPIVLALSRLVFVSIQKLRAFRFETVSLISSSLFKTLPKILSSCLRRGQPEAEIVDEVFLTVVVHLEEMF